MLNKIKNIISTDKYLYLVVFSLFFIPMAALVPMFNDLWYMQYLALLLVIALGVSISLWQTNRFISLFVMYSCFSFIYVTKVDAMAFYVFVEIIICSLAIKVVSSLTRHQVRVVFNALLIMVVLQGGYVILQAFNLDPFFDNLKDRTIDDTVGLCGNHNQLGLYFAALTPLIMFLWPGLIILVGIGIFYSTTTIAYIASVFSVLYFLYFKYRKYFCYALLWLSLFSIFYLWKIDKYSEDKVVERYLLWRHTIQAVEKQRITPRKDNVIYIKKCDKWFGYGNGMFIRLSPRAQKDAFMGSMNVRTGRPQHVYEHAHNDYIEFFFDYGRIGAILLILFIGDLFRKFWISRKTKILVISFGCLVSMMICATFIYTVQTAVSGSLWVLFLGIFLGEVKRDEQNRKARPRSIVVQGAQGLRTLFGGGVL